MLYSELNDGQRTMIEANSVFLADYSEAIGKSGVVVHVLKLNKASYDAMPKEIKEQYASDGYVPCSAAVWFETSAARMSGDEAFRFGEQAANS